MTQKEATDYLAEQLNRSRSETQRLLDQTTQVMQEVLDGERDIVLPGLGTFHTKLREKRRGFHPRRKQYMILPQKRVVSFHAGLSLRNYVKNMRIEK
jgi:nucleoid DNA-binding protein